jgi:hypothetical protein
MTVGRPAHPVYVVAAAHRVAGSEGSGSGGDSARVLWDRLQRGVEAPPPTKVDRPGVPPSVSARLLEPAVEVHPRIGRTMDPQARHLLGVARRMAGEVPGGLDGPVTGLYLAMPTVDQEYPSLEGLADQPPGGFSPQRWADACHPLLGLTLLNSTAAAHVAADLQVTGSMGVFASGEMAGIDAIAGAATELGRGRDLGDRMALVGGVAQTVNACLVIQHEAQGRTAQAEVPGEGAAMVALTRAPPADRPRLRLLGWTRSVIEREERHHGRHRLVRAALAAVGIGGNVSIRHLQDGPVVPEATTTDVLPDHRRLTGSLGPATACLRLALAATVLEASPPGSVVAVHGGSAPGSCGVMLIQREADV